MKIDPILNHPVGDLNKIREPSARSLGEGKYTDEDLKKACREFEAIFTQQLLQVMWDTVPKGGLFSDSPAQKIWQGMYIEELAKVTSEGEGIGIAKSLYNQLRAEKSYFTKE